MHRSRAATATLILAAALCGLAPCAALAETQSVHTRIDFTCSGGSPASYEEFATVRVEVAGTRLSMSLNSFPVGSPTLRVVPEPPVAGAVWIVREIKFFDFSDGSKQEFTPTDKEALVTLRVGPRRGGGISTLTIVVDQCGGNAPSKPPIVFLPGVGGTAIRDLGTGNELWPVNVYGSPFKMMLDRDGIGGADHVKLGDILRSGVANFYGDFIQYLVGKGYVEGKDLFTLPYDWRLDPDSPTIAQQLGAKIDEALAKSGARKVVLAAHSLGGVVSRAYLIEHPEAAAKVEALVTMGTPYWGNVHPFYALIDGYDFGNPFVTQKTMKILGRNFPSAHFLTSRVPFMEDERGVELSREESFQIQYRGYVKGPGGIDDYQPAEGLVWNLNSTIVQRANAFWSKMGTPAAPTPLPAGIMHYVILGHGIRTFNRYRIRPAEGDDWIAIGARRVVLEPMFGDGDITVPIWSSQIETATRTYYVKYREGSGGSTIGRLAPQHGDLTKLPVVQSLFWDIVRGQPPRGDSYGEPSWLKALEWVDFTLHSDAHLSVKDDVNGGRLGFADNGGIEQTLSGGTFLAIGQAEHATLANESDRYKVEVAGVREGKFTLEIRVGRGAGTIADLRYPEVPVKPGTLAELTLIPSQAGTAPPVLRVTTDGRTTEVPAAGGAGGAGQPGTPTRPSGNPPAGQTNQPPATSPCAPIDPSFEPDTNRYGGDYRNVELREMCPERCAEACRLDARCKAWSFVRPGYESAGCWLKDVATRPTANPCCISGLPAPVFGRPEAPGPSATLPGSGASAAPTGATPMPGDGSTSAPQPPGVGVGTPPSPPTGAPQPASAPPGGAGGAGAASEPCPADFRGHRGRSGPLACYCSALAAASGSVYGDDPYTDDSVICRAAVHAGVISTAGGAVQVFPLPGRPAYGGSTRNGVTSSHWHGYDFSFSLGASDAAQPTTVNRPLDCPANFTLQRGSTTPLVCYCPPSDVGFGSAYGTDIYTDDSRICAAALHAGAVTAAGGAVRVEAMPGQETYVGSRRNGFTSEDWGSYHSSFRVSSAER